MQKLSKRPKPPILITSEVQWTAEYAASTASKPPRRWRHPQVLAVLRTETFGKCAYCEGVVGDVSFDQVEHILPRRHRPDLVVAWENLTIACNRCNNAKSDYYEPAAPLIHPYDDDPSDCLDFRGPAVYAKLGCDRGERTVQQLQLMRHELLIERLKRIEYVQSLIRRWHEATGTDRAFREAAVRDAIAADKEFSACLTAEATAMGFPV